MPWRCLGDALAMLNRVNLSGYKGILAFVQDGSVVRYVLQGVHDVVDMSYAGEWPSECPGPTRFLGLSEATSTNPGQELNIWKIDRV